MSYILKHTDVDRIEFNQERAPMVFRWLVLLLGVVAVCAGPAFYYLKYVRGFELPLMIAGFGILLIAAGELLRIQFRGLPAVMALDNRKGVLEIQERDGRVFALGYGDIERVALRMRGRGRMIVSLIRKNGAYWDLFRTNRRSSASAVGNRVQNFLDQGRRKERTYPAPGAGFTQTTDPAGIYWRDRLTSRASAWIFLLLTGVGLLVAGFLLRADLSRELAFGAPAVGLGVLAAYLAYALRFDRRGLRIEARGLSYGFTRGDDWISRKSIDFDQIVGVLYNFDMYGGPPELLIPDVELYPRITGRDLSTTGAGNGPRTSGAKSTAGAGLARIKADLRAGLRVPRLGLSGVGAGDALALEFWLEGRCREHRT
ncbi:MAG: hypothetical protein RIF32_20720 [Leptospirales bacterium]|jgi:hypothetical protein